MVDSVTDELLNFLAVRSLGKRKPGNVKRLKKMKSIEAYRV